MVKRCKQNKGGVMKDEIIILLKTYSVEIENWNYGILEDDFDKVADALIELIYQKQMNHAKQNKPTC